MSRETALHYRSLAETARDIHTGAVSSADNAERVQAISTVGYGCMSGCSAAMCFQRRSVAHPHA